MKQGEDDAENIKDQMVSLDASFLVFEWVATAKTYSIIHYQTSPGRVFDVNEIKLVILISSVEMECVRSISGLSPKARHLWCLESVLSFVYSFIPVALKVSNQNCMSILAIALIHP